MTRKDIKESAKQALGKQIFGDIWLMAVLACLIYALLVGAAGSVIPAIGAVIVTGPMAYGLTFIFIRLVRDKEPIKLENLFKGFSDDFSQTFLIGLMTGIFTFLWSLLFIIPGIIKSYAYSMAYYVKVDHPDYDWNACIKESCRIMKGHKWELFVLKLSFIGWIIVGYLALGVGLLWVAPYMRASTAVFYDSIKNQPAIY